MPIPTLSLPELPPGGVTAGVDWATTDHAVAIVDHRGRATHRFAVTANADGLRELVRRLRHAHVEEVGIERSDGQVVDTLIAAGFTVVVIPPGQVANLRGRYGSAGNKDDRFDAYVLADTVRTDRARLRPMVPDTPATVLLRSAVRARKDLLTHRVGLANQLRAHLEFFYPGPVKLFADLDSITSLRFLTRFTCQDDADWLTPSRLTTWLRHVAYTGKKDPAVLHAHLTAAPRGATGPAGAAAAAVTTAFVAALTTLVEQIHILNKHIAALLTQHPDAPIFLSLPRAQALRAARLLAEIGDCRGRYPTPESLASLAGVTPSTRQSDARPSPRSDGRPTNSCATRSATSPPTPATPTPGPNTSTTRPAPADTATHTPSGSSPAPGYTSSGGVGRTTSPTTPPATTPSAASSRTRPRRQPDHPFPGGPAPALARHRCEEGSTWSARSEARTNDVDADDQRCTLPSGIGQGVDTGL